MKPVLSTALALFASFTTFDMEVSAQHRLLQPQADSYMKLGDIKGEFRSEPDSFMKLGDIKGEFRSEPDSYMKLGDIKGEFRSEPDSYMKLGDIKGEFRSEPDSYMKLGDIKGEFRSDASSDESKDAELLWELDHLIWEAEADDFLWFD